MGAHRDLVAIVGGFLSCFFQISFELLDSLIKRSIIIETFRLEQILWPRSVVSNKKLLTKSQKKKARTCHSRLVSSARRSFRFVKYCRSFSF